MCDKDTKVAAMPMVERVRKSPESWTPNQIARAIKEHGRISMQIERLRWKQVSLASDIRESVRNLKI